MLPTLRPGDRLALRRGGQLRPGDIVAVADPRHHDRILVKRIHAVDGGRVDVRGDAADCSTDSRTFGPVDADAVIGRAVYRYSPPGRTGPINRHHPGQA